MQSTTTAAPEESTIGGLLTALALVMGLAGILLCGLGLGYVYGQMQKRKAETEAERKKRPDRFFQRGFEDSHYSADDLSGGDTPNGVSASSSGQNKSRSGGKNTGGKTSLAAFHSAGMTETAVAKFSKLRASARSADTGSGNYRAAIKSSRPATGNGTPEQAPE